MIKNYLTIFLRNILKYKTFSLINIFGLVLGIACFSIITLFAEFEFSYDRFHRDPDNIYRIVKDFVNNGVRTPDATTAPALSASLRAGLPEVEAATRFFPNGGRRNLFQYGDKQFYELDLLRIDSSFFKVFDFTFSRGSKDLPFNGVHSMLLTETAARRYFGDENPIGKIIRTNINGQTDFEVTGVLKDVPPNSHFSFQVLIPLQASSRSLDADWRRNTFYTYARLRPGSDPVAFESKVEDMVKRHVPESLDDYTIQRITDIHLTSRLKGELGSNGDLQYVNILLIIGVFVLLIAGVNYINLVTAQSVKRAKEIGVRKVTGAVRGSLIFQFLFESLAMVLVSSMLAFVLVYAMLPYTAPVLGIDLSPMLYSSRSIRYVQPISIMVIGILAGVYPAFYLSSFRPLRILRGKLFSSSHGIRLRQGLVVFQFVVSGVLITGFLVIHQQLQFIRNKNLGYDQQAVLTIPNVVGTASAEVIAEDFRKIAGVQSVAQASGGLLGFQNAINGVADRNRNNHISLNFVRVDYDFVPTLGIGLIQGRNFSRAFPSDSSAIILNEAAVSQLGLKPPVVGQSLQWDDQEDSTHSVQIVGVVRDFHFTSFHEQIKPFGFTLERGNGSTFLVKISGNTTATLAEVGKVWKKYNPDKPFDYVFQDEYTAGLHATEERFQKLFSTFTIVAIAIACLGLFGLVTALSEAKTKEIGVRKVMGSSVSGIVGLLTREFIGLVVLAFVVATPVSFLIMKHWLEGFAYRVDLHWPVFVIAGIATVFVAMATVSFQSIKAALANPVDSLRNE